MSLSLSQNKDWIVAQNEKAAAGATTPAWLQAGLPAADDRHEAVLFIKPELTELGSDKLPAFLEMVDAACAKFGVEILNVGCLGWSYMAKYNIAGEHYGVINKISREGISALSAPVQQKLRETFGLPDSQVYGAHQFIAKFPEWTAETLGALWENLNATHTQKLAPGTYAQKFQYGSETFVILAGFHPLQLLHFTAEKPVGRSIVVCPVRSSTDWATLRNDMVGETDPNNAPAGALRAELLANKDKLGIPVVSKGLNGIHLSAGPLEGMVELIRFTSNRSENQSVSLESTNFGSLWLKSGGSASELADLANNPMLNLDGKTISAFDATELMNATDAVSALRQGLKAAA